MKYQHSFTVRAPLSRVAEFHRQPASMGAITPPVIWVRVHRAPARLNNGDEMEFTLWLGPLPVRWLARFEQVSAAGFVDRQVCGPFKQWVHRHVFVSLDETTTEVRDEVQAELKLHPLWGPVSLSMWLGLSLLFAYRGWKTKRLLESQTG